MSHDEKSPPPPNAPSVKHSYMTRSKSNRGRASTKSIKSKASIPSPSPSTDSDSISDSDVDDDDDNEEDTQINTKQYREFLNELFPSQYMQAKAANTPASVYRGKKRKDFASDLAAGLAAQIMNDTTSCHASCTNVMSSKSKKARCEDADQPRKGEPMPSLFNIVFRVAELDRQDENEVETEHVLEHNDDDEQDLNEVTPVPVRKTKKLKASDIVDSISEIIDRIPKKQLVKKPEMQRIINDITNCLHDNADAYVEDKLDEQSVQRQRSINTMKFSTLLQDNKSTNDFRFFEQELSLDEQRSVLAKVKEIRKHTDVSKPYRLALLDADIPMQFKSIAFRKINTLRSMEPGAGEYYKMKNWVDAFMRVPFGKYKTLPISLDDGVEKCHAFMENAKKTLDQAVYGLNDAKLQIMQMLGQWLVNPEAIGSAIAIKGPMGTGKTTLVKEGISQILGRDFAFIALGGATDSAYLEGHSYTYEGSKWGQIVDILIKSKSMNPVIYFDELDKVSETPKGEEIIGILTHLTDTTQNSRFHDRYFAELEFDLSRCLFIFSYNDESKINPILRDRMYRIQTKGYSSQDKNIIAAQYLLPKIREQIKFREDDVIIPPETLDYIIYHCTGTEDGVRNLKRCLEIVYTKLNLYRLMNPGTNLFEADMSLSVSFPVTITPSIVDKLIKRDDDKGVWKNMYA